MNGSDVIIKVNTGTPTVPVWTVVGKQSGLKISEKVGVIDGSGKEDGERVVEGGRYEATLTLDALYVPTDAAYTALRTAFRSAALTKVQTIVSGTAKEHADALISGMDGDFPDQGSATISVTLEVSGAWTTEP